MRGMSVVVAALLATSALACASRHDYSQYGDKGQECAAEMTLASMSADCGKTAGMSGGGVCPAWIGLSNAEVCYMVHRWKMDCVHGRAHPTWVELELEYAQRRDAGEVSCSQLWAGACCTIHEPSWVELGSETSPGDD
jgi:hypothetical protein